MREHAVYVGNFYLVDNEGGEAFTSKDEEVLMLFGSQAATAIANARTYRDGQRAPADLEALVKTSLIGVAVFDAGTGEVFSLSLEAKRIVGSLCHARAVPWAAPEILTCRRADPVGGLRDHLGYARGSETVPGAPYLVPRFARFLRRRNSTATIRIDARITNKVATERMAGLMFSRRPSNISRGKVR